MLSSRHRKTYEAIQTNPVLASIRWDAIEAMLVAFGAEVEERAGSRVAITLNGQVAVFHRPHPRPDTDRGAVKSIRRFLALAGADPDSEAREGDEGSDEEDDR